MKLAETVTFGGPGLERAAEFRTDPQKIAALLGARDARVLPVWRGKPLFCNETCDALQLLAPDHQIFADAPEPAVFLGLDGGLPIFGRDISGWAGPVDEPVGSSGFHDQSIQQHPSLATDCRFAELRIHMARLPAPQASLAVTATGLFTWHHTHRFCPNCGAATEIAAAGWQRRCPACARLHFPHIEPVVIMLITHGNDLLIGRSPGWPEGMYSLLAGFMEPGETVEAAVRREVFEETAVRVSAVSYLASQPWPFPASLMIGCRGEATTREIIIDEKEIEDACWVSREQVMDAWATKSSTRIAARKGAIAHFLIRNWLSDTLD